MILKKHHACEVNPWCMIDRELTSHEKYYANQKGLKCRAGRNGHAYMHIGFPEESNAESQSGFPPSEMNCMNL